MYYLYGIPYHTENLKKVVTGKTLRAGYDQFIKENSVFDHELITALPKIVNFSGLSSYAKGFCRQKKIFFAENPPELNEKIRSGYFERALDKLRLEQSELYDLVCFYMKVIVINYLAEYIEGTTDYYLGLSCLDFRTHYEINDFYELLFHQVVHKMTFIDNRLHLQLKEQYKNIILPTSFVHKAGGNNFSLYMAFHSFLVGVEILIYRIKSNTVDFKGNYHGDTSSIIRKTLKGATVLERYYDCFTLHGQEILSRAFHFLKTFQQEKAYENIHT